MDLIMDASKDAHEPEWLEKDVIGEIRLWQVIFICFAAVTSLIVMVCCCFRFRIPRTKQQIEADYQRRKITCKFRQQLETIQDAQMDAMSLHDALELLHEKDNNMENSNNNHGTQPGSTSPPAPQQDSVAAPGQAQGEQAPQCQDSSSNFAKFANKIANLSRLTGPKSPTSPTPSGTTKMDF